jgi:hypothetical protein
MFRDECEGFQFLHQVALGPSLSLGISARGSDAPISPQLTGYYFRHQELSASKGTIGRKP